MLLDEKAEPDRAADDVLRFGPPAGGGAGPSPRGRPTSRSGPPPIARLEAWAAEWNRLGRQPKAPDPINSAEVYLSTWKTWYARMKTYPLE